ILVVPDGRLQYVPFAALPLPGKEKDKFLINQYEILTLPSSSVVTTIRNEQKNRKTAPNILAIFADPVYQPDDKNYTVMLKRAYNLLYQAKEQS
ncbi:MAG: CHAT domain-containing protein, partial [Nostocales cyanobacterium W4_Combined_metabat2_030]|nr:CHAT domain-containing protein [Nostocales cyanobacterium W4_Combined_metabat2_030]